MADRLDAQRKRKRDDMSQESPEPLLIGGYSNESNPFGDSHLSSTFEWKLKKDKMMKQGVDPGLDSKEAQRRRALELQREIEKLKERRRERDEERERWENERTRMAREKDLRTVTQFEKDEDKFLYNQLKQKALIRLNEGRGEPIDWLILVYLHALKLVRASRGLDEKDAPGGRDGALLSDGSEIPLPALPPATMPPSDVIQYVVQTALANAAAAAQTQQQQQQHRSIRYAAAPSHSGSPAAAAAAALAADPKAQLMKLRESVRLFMDLEESQLRAQDAAVKDGASRSETAPVVVQDFWGSLLVLVDDKIAELARTADEGTLHDALIAEISTLFADKSYEELVATEADMQAQLVSAAQSDVAIDEEHFHTILKYLGVCKARARLLQIYDSVMAEARKLLESEAAAAAAAADEDGGEGERSGTGLRGAAAVSGPAITEEDLFQREIARGLDDNEEAFNQEVALPARGGGSSSSSSSLQGPYQDWPEKYRPRKPRYFNRVKTGYEWNKYNQTHYDSDTPPPKIVQGYKFTLFYPDLIDKTKTPKFYIQKTDSPDFVYLRFHAGPPYEDVAFKIVNREWENSHKKGFKSQFSNGILYLWFNFKRYRYRR